jgi:putative ABC transport system permease protein
MRSGRSFDARDRLGAPSVMVVNESFARKYFPNGDAIGRRVAFSWGIDGMQTVIGVVGDIREGALDEPAAPAMYVSYGQRPIDAMNILVRTAGEPMDAVAVLRKTVLAIDANLPITQVRTLTDVLASGIAGPRLSATLLGVFSVVALFLAAVGLYGVVSFSVLQRTREIGIRAALGAQREDILRLVLGQGLVLVTIGLAVGLLLAIGSQRIVASQLFGIGPHDPMTFGAVALTLAVVALGAAVLPALRATRIDPLVALREE